MLSTGIDIEPKKIYYVLLFFYPFPIFLLFAKKEKFMPLDLKTVYLTSSMVFIVLGILIYIQSLNYKKYVRGLTYWNIATITLAVGLLLNLFQEYFHNTYIYFLGDIIIYSSIILIYFGVLLILGVKLNTWIHVLVFAILIALSSYFYFIHSQQAYRVILDSLYIMGYSAAISNQLVRYSKKQNKRIYLGIAVPMITVAINSIIRLFFALFRYENVEYFKIGSAEAFFLNIYFICYGIFIVGIYFTFSDEVKQMLEQTIRDKEAALTKNKLLIREMNHRVKNNLTTIQGLLQLQSSETSDRGAKNVLTESANRIRAISDIHTILSQNDDIRKINCVFYFRRMVDYFDITFKSLFPDVTMKTKFGIQEMDIDLLIPVALIVNELITNAYKHAFDPGDHGTIEIAMRHKNESGIELIVKDTGKGLPEGFKVTSKASFGMDIISSFVQQLDGDLNFQSKAGQGTTFTISFKDV